MTSIDRMRASASVESSKLKPLGTSFSFRRLRVKSLVRNGSGNGETPPALPPSASSDRPPLPTQLQHENQWIAAVSDVSDTDSHLSEPQPPAWPLETRYCKCYCEENTYLLTRELNSALEDRPSEGAPDPGGWTWDLWVVFVSNAEQRVLLWQQRAAKSRGCGSPVIWDYHVFPVVTAQRSQQAQTSETRPTVTHGDAQQSPPRKPRVPPLSFFRRATSSGNREAGSGSMRGLSFNGYTVPTPLTKSKDRMPAANPHWRGWVYDVDSLLCCPSGGEADSETQRLQPVPFETYIQQTFGAYEDHRAPAELRPTFRLARSACFLDNFASDRSHMLLEPLPSDDPAFVLDSNARQLYRSPPPDWLPIAGPRAIRKGWKNNLMTEWVAMNVQREPASETLSRKSHPELSIQFGTVLTEEDFFCGQWQQLRWKRRRPATANKANDKEKGRRRRREVDTDDSTGTPPSIERVTSHHHICTLPAKERSRGGRVTSPLFPAYLHQALEARAARDRQSYLLLKGVTADNKTESGVSSAIHRPPATAA